MNKKKFLATCTLVAFGSTMLPAFAFAAAGEATATSWTLGSSTVKITADDADEWVDTKDSVVVKKQDKSNGRWIEVEVADVKITDFIPAGSGSATAGFADVTLKTPLTAGYYQFEIIDSDGAGQTAGETTVAAVDAGSAISVLEVKNGKVASFTPASDGGKVGMIVIAKDSAVANAQYLYPLANENDIIAKDSESDLQTEASGYIAADKLRVGWYGVAANASYANATAPSYVVEYTQAEADEAALAKTILKADLEKRVALIPDSITITAANGTGVNVLTKLEETDKTNTLKAADLAVAEVTGNLSGYVTVTSSFANGIFSAVGTSDSGAIDTKGAKSVTGTVTVAAPIIGATGMYVTKDVAVTVNNAQAIETAVDAYGAENFTAYNKESNTGKIEFAKVGEGFDLTTELTGLDATSPSAVLKTGKYTIGPVTGASEFTLAKYFDKATGKVIALPEEDLVLTVTLQLKDATPAAITGAKDIKVTTTIKAAGATDPDLEEAEKVANEKAKAFASVAGTAMSDGKVTKAEWASMMASYAEFMTAYNAYVEAGGKA